MRETAIQLERFYASPLGEVAHDMATRRLNALWPDLSGKNVLGYGYCQPYLQPHLSSANRVVLAMDEGQGAVAHGGKRGVSTLLCEGRALPFSDASFDYVLAVHALEESEMRDAMLAELFRVLCPEGRIVIMAPNRRGLWAQSENQPFGAGRPYSRRQLKASLSRAGFVPTVAANALYMPPIRRLSGPRLSLAAERFGEVVWPGFSGLVLVEAIKRLYAPNDRGHAEKIARPKFSGVPVMNKTQTSSLK